MMNVKGGLNLLETKEKRFMDYELCKVTFYLKSKLNKIKFILTYAEQVSQSFFWGVFELSTVILIASADGFVLK